MAAYVPLIRIHAGRAIVERAIDRMRANPGNDLLAESVMIVTARGGHEVLIDTDHQTEGDAVALASYLLGYFDAKGTRAELL
jgi:hypothetical protein